MEIAVRGASWSSDRQLSRKWIKTNEITLGRIYGGPLRRMPVSGSLADMFAVGCYWLWAASRQRLLLTRADFTSRRYRAINQREILETGEEPRVRVRRERCLGAACYPNATSLSSLSIL